MRMAVDAYMERTLKRSFGRGYTKRGFNIHEDFYEPHECNAIKSLDMELANDIYGFPKPTNKNWTGKPYGKKRKQAIWDDFERF